MRFESEQARRNKVNRRWRMERTMREIDAIVPLQGWHRQTSEIVQKPLIGADVSREWTPSSWV